MPFVTSSHSHKLSFEPKNLNVSAKTSVFSWGLWKSIFSLLGVSAVYMSNPSNLWCRILIVTSPSFFVEEFEDIEGFDRLGCGFFILRGFFGIVYPFNFPCFGLLQ